MKNYGEALNRLAAGFDVVLELKYSARPAMYFKGWGAAEAMRQRMIREGIIRPRDAVVQSIYDWTRKNDDSIREGGLWMKK